MKKRWKLSSILWLMLLVDCVFHFFWEGRNIHIMGKLMAKGMTRAEAFDKVTWLCGPLNLAAIFLFFGALISMIVEALIRWRTEKKGNS